MGDWDGQQYEYLIVQLEPEEFNHQALNRYYGQNGWQIVHVESVSVEDMGYDDDSRKIMVFSKKRLVTFMREILRNPEQDV